MLSEEYSGILNWALEGFQDYLKNGLVIPGIVKRATSEYMCTFDTVGTFIGDCCSEDFLGKVELKSLYEEYLRWSTEEHKTFTYDKRAFRELLEQKGYRVTKKRRRLTVEGLKIYNPYHN